jgi:four helix bundle protein
MAYRSFEELEVWQRGCRLSVAIFETFESCKRFTRRDQIERTGLSIPSNIAEGAERGSSKDFAHFLNFSKGSCGELRTQLYIARRLKAVSKGAFDSLIRESREISAMLQGLRTAMLRKTAPKQKRTHRNGLKLKT